MDKARERQAEKNSRAVETAGSIPQSQSSTLVVADPVSKRVIGLLRGLSNMYAQWQDKDRDFLIRQIRIILDAIVEEIEEDDRAIFANQTSQLMILNFAKLLEWTVHGDISALPESLIPIACDIEGIVWQYEARNDETVAETTKVLLPVALPASDQAADAE